MNRNVDSSRAPANGIEAERSAKATDRTEAPPPPPREPRREVEPPPPGRMPDPRDEPAWRGREPGPDMRGAAYGPEGGRRAGYPEGGGEYGEYGRAPGGAYARERRGGGYGYGYGYGGGYGGERPGAYRAEEEERYRRAFERDPYEQGGAPSNAYQRAAAERAHFDRYRDEMQAASIPSTYGNVTYDQWRQTGHHTPWRGRDEEHDFWGQDRHPQEAHGAHGEEHASRGLPRLWERVKGVFTGKGPKNYVRPDERIREDVCEHLSYHPYIDATDIEVIVREGEVTLTGTVDARMVKRAAEECAEHVRGVKDIHNHLRVIPPVLAPER